MEFNSNPRNYDRRIGGVRPETLIITLLSVLVASVFYELFGFAGTIPFFVILLLGIVRIGDETLFRFLTLRIVHTLSRSVISFNSDKRVYSRNGATFIADGHTCYLPVAITSNNTIGLSSETHARIVGTIREMLNSLECDFSIQIRPSVKKEGDATNSAASDYDKLKEIVVENTCYHQPFLVLSERTKGKTGISEGILLTQLGKISGFLKSAGLSWYLPEIEESEKMLFFDNGSVKANSSGRFVIETGKRFFMLNGGYFMAIQVRDFKNGPLRFLSQGIDSLDFPCSVNLGASVYETARARKLLKYMITERSTDVKLQRRNSSSENNAAVRQLKELRQFLRDIDGEGDRLIDYSCTLMISASEPTDLTKRYHRITALLDFLGLEYSTVEYYTRNKVRKLMPFESKAKGFLTGSRNMAGILPLFFTSHDDQGVMIGINSATEKPEMFDLFGKNSFNVIVLGETGSGKSHFSKVLLRRSLISSTVDKLLVIDPLEEYSTDIFKGKGRILNLSKGDYIEIPATESFDALNYMIALISRAIDIRPADMVKVRSVIAGCIQGGDSAINSILEALKQELTDYAEELNYIKQVHFRNPISMNEGRYDVTIIRFSTREQINRDIQLLQMAASAYSWMSADNSRKAVMIDEAHMMLEDDSVTRILDSLVRNSRHFNTGVINVTQNFSDFQRTEYSRNIINNTSEFFVFRNKTDGNEFRSLFGDMIPRDDFIMNLRGGKNDRYSECVRVLNSRAYPIRIISTEEEKKAIG